MLNASPLQVKNNPLVEKIIPQLLPAIPNLKVKAYLPDFWCIVIEIYTPQPFDVVVGMYSSGKYIAMFHWHLEPGNNINSIQKDFKKFRRMYIGVWDCYNRKVTNPMRLNMPLSANWQPMQIVTGKS